MLLPVLDHSATELRLMWGFNLSFDEPRWLWALPAVAVLAVYSYRTLLGLAPLRRFFAVAIRSLILTAIVLVLAEVQVVRLTDKVTVLYLLDQSESIPRDRRQYMLEYVVREVSEHRRVTDEDRAGIIVFGGRAQIEVPPIDMSLPMISRAESVVDLKDDVTSLEAALQLAKATFPEDSSRRIVIVTDGNENLGNATQSARALTEDGVGIDVLAVRLPERSEVSVEKVVVPVDLRQGQSFEAKIVVENRVLQTGQPSDPQQPTRGRLRLVEREGSDTRLISEEVVELEPGTNVFSYNHKIERTALLTYEAEFVADDPERDFRIQNNQATAYAHVRGKGRVLWISDDDAKLHYEDLVLRLKSQELEVDMMSTSSLFSDASDLLEYDCIVLANVARTSDSIDAQGNEVAYFTDAQIEMLVSNTSEFGCGLVMLGGDQSFGVGGWANSRLEEAMPVNFQIMNDRIESVGALAIVMHASEMEQGNYWQKAIGVAAIETLGPMDYCGVVVWQDFTGGVKWLWGQGQGGMLRVGPTRRLMLGAVQQMAPGDMPNFEDSMVLAHQGLSNVGASVKHMIIISDGDPAPPPQSLIQKFIDDNIEISTVAVGTHGPAMLPPMQQIADDTGGKFYNVTSPQALPRIFQREARRVAKPLIFERASGIGVVPRPTAFAHPALQGIPVDQLPAVRGYVATEVKQNPLVEQLLIAEAPDDNGLNSTLMATWQFGLGRATVITTDSGLRWTDSWLDQNYYDRFYGQLIRHAMRPVDESANFTIASQIEDGKVRLVITALDEQDEFINGLPMVARSVSPDQSGSPIEIRQTAPGRYEGTFDANDAGSYLFSVIPGEGYDRLSGGVSVPVSGEFSDFQTNWPLLETLVAFSPRDGVDGVLIGEDVHPDSYSDLLEQDTFRRGLRPAQSIQDIWPWLLLAVGFAFFVDVLVRRVNLDLLVPLRAVRRRLSRQKQEAVEEPKHLGRLQARKRDVDRKTQAGDTRFAEPPGSSSTAPESIESLLQTPAVPSRPQPKKPTMTQEGPSYTERLRAAKERARRDRKDDPGQ